MENITRFVLRDSAIKARACLAINMVDTTGELMECVIRPHKKKRSLAQNNLLWKWLTEISVFIDQEHGQKFKPEELKAEFQERYLGFEAYKKLDGSIGKKLIGTSKLTVLQKRDFLESIEYYARSEIGVNLTHPEDYYYEAMGK